MDGLAQSIADHDIESIPCACRFETLGEDGGEIHPRDLYSQLAFDCAVEGDERVYQVTHTLCEVHFAEFHVSRGLPMPLPPRPTACRCLLPWRARARRNRCRRITARSRARRASLAIRYRSSGRCHLCRVHRRAAGNSRARLCRLFLPLALLSPSQAHRRLYTPYGSPEPDSPGPSRHGSPLGSPNLPLGDLGVLGFSASCRRRSRLRPHAHHHTTGTRRSRRRQGRLFRIATVAVSAV